MKAAINGISLYYTDSQTASKETVVFIHGFPFSQAMWEDQAALVSQDFRVITFDNRGHGQSDAGDGQYPFEFFVDDLFALLDYLKIEKAILCGLSMGGYMALRAVERNPERVRALVLCDTRSEADSNEVKLKRTAGVRTVKRDGVKVFAEGFLKGVFTSQSFTTRQAAVEKIRRMIESTPPAGIAGTLIALATRTDTTAALAGIHVPTLILVGDQDPITPPAAAQAMKDKIPHAELHVIPQASHLSNLENPEIFNQHLMAFLKKLPPRS